MQGIVNAIFVAVLATACVDRTAAPAGGAHSPMLVAGTWSGSSPGGVGSYQNRYAGVLAVGADGSPVIVVGQSYQNGSFYDSDVLALRPPTTGTAWSTQYLGNHQWSTSLGQSVDAAVGPDGSVCAAYSRPYDGDLLLHCGGTLQWVDEAGARYQVSLALDDAGQPWVAWPTADDVRLRAPDGTVSTVTSGYWSDGAVEIAFGPDGRLHVAAEVFPTSTTREIRLLSQQADGSWSTDVIPTEESWWVGNSALGLAVSDIGERTVAYVRPVGSDDDHQLVLWREGAEEVLLTGEYGASVALGHAHGALHAVWSAGGVLTLGVEGPGGWETETIPASRYQQPSGLDDTLQLVFDGTGTPHVGVLSQGAPYWWRRSGQAVEAPAELRTVGDLVHGDLVITEVMANPAAVPDDVGEWIEVHNPGDAPIDLDGLEIVDRAGNRGAIEGTAVIAAGGTALLGRRDAERFAPAELAPLATYGFEPPLNNTGDRIELVGPNGVIDQVEVPSAGTRSGASWQLTAGRTDADANDDPAAWCAGATAYPGGDLGTPGAPNDDC